MKNAYTIVDDIVYIHINHRGNIEKVSIDLLDLPLMQMYPVRWWLKPSTSRGKSYAWTTINGKKVTLHRLIMGAKDGEIVDHINGDTHKNTRDNLRIVDRYVNARNIEGVPRNNTSGYKGVSWSQKSMRWVATIRVYNKLHHLGQFKELYEAVEARRIGEETYWGSNR